MTKKELIAKLTELDGSELIKWWLDNITLHRDQMIKAWEEIPVELKEKLFNALRQYSRDGGFFETKS